MPDRDRRVSFAVQQWIAALLSQRKVSVQAGSTYIRVKTQCSLPQGGGLSPTLWSLVADSLLKWLSKQGVLAQGFADVNVNVNELFLSPRESCNISYLQRNRTAVWVSFGWP